MAELTAVQQDYIGMEKRYQAEIKPFMEAFKEAKRVLAETHGIGSHFQDNEGTVYLIVEPAGRFVAFDKVGVQRTRREGEAKGDLSMTAARELGYQVEGK